jgi:mono/diheme cytochrome c family protein
LIPFFPGRPLHPLRLLRTFLLAAALCAVCLECWTACNQGSGSSGNPKAQAGRGLYLANCIACHNMNPALDGTLGPALKGSSLELVQARVLRGEYPIGYTPKRKTGIMIKLPLTEENVEAIQAFLSLP